MSCTAGCEAEDTETKPKRKADWILRLSALVVASAYVAHLLGAGLGHFAHSVFELVNTVWWGVAIGVLMIAALGRIPREFVMSVLGAGTGARSIIRATITGVLLDLCNHGVLMVGAKLYERGASTAQMMAFLIASPWNSLSLTLILLALVGAHWTIAFVALSMVVAVVSGLIFAALERGHVLPVNPNAAEIDPEFRFWREAEAQWAELQITPSWLWETLREGVKDSRIVVRWILFGIVLASLMRAFIDADAYAQFFGPTLAGLGATLVMATLLEVCSEGSTPIAADILTRAGAPGNSFAFLMGGVATDYTEVMVLKDTTQSWKIALALPLVTLPQIVFLAWLINQAS